MSKLFVAVEDHIEAPADLVFEIIRDFDGHHRRILPPAFSDFEVEQGERGDGTVSRFKMTLGGRTFDARSHATEPEPGVIRETMLDRDLVTHFRVVPEGDGSRVSITTEWAAAGGVGGLLERVFAPSMFRKIYRQELTLLADYARTLAAQQPAAVAG